MSSGASTLSTSGPIFIRTAEGGSLGASGSMYFTTGDAESGDSGSIVMETGSSAEGGSGGSISMCVGTGASGDGGNLELVAGDSKATDGVGGKLSLFGGNSIHTNGGNGAEYCFRADFHLRPNLQTVKVETCLSRRHCPQRQWGLCFSIFRSWTGQFIWQSHTVYYQCW